MSRNVEAVPHDAYHSSGRIRRSGWNLQINTEMSPKASGAKINIYQRYGNANVWRMKSSAHDPKYKSTLVKHGGGSVMVPASRMGSPIYINEVPRDDSSRINSETSSLIGRNCIMQQDHDPKHTANTTNSACLSPHEEETGEA